MIKGATSRNEINDESKVKVKYTGSSQSNLQHRYGNSHAI